MVKTVTKFDDYQEACLKTWTLDDERPYSDHLLHVAVGLASEAGEFAGLIDKQVFKPNKRITREQLIDELGDVMYNVAMAAYLMGITLTELQQANMEKLKDGHGWIE